MSSRIRYTTEKLYEVKQKNLRINSNSQSKLEQLLAQDFSGQRSRCKALYKVSLLKMYLKHDS